MTNAVREIVRGRTSPGHSLRLELVPETRGARCAPRCASSTFLAARRRLPALGDIVPTDLNAPELYLNRELTYLNFCWRVLHQAEDDRLPLTSSA